MVSMRSQRKARAAANLGLQQKDRSKSSKKLEDEDGKDISHMVHKPIGTFVRFERRGNSFDTVFVSMREQTNTH